MVLVDTANNVLGTIPKQLVHHANTPLHRAFSVFLFNKKGEILLQQRSHKKKTWPLVWSNSCCGHPLPNENTEDAVRRRVSFELGISEIKKLRELVPDFSYKAERDGIVEHELCPVWVGEIDDLVRPNLDEVEATCWMLWEDFVQEIGGHPEKYSEWCGWEVKELLKTFFQRSSPGM